MSETIVLITGVGRGLGKAFLETYLSRPNHTVIGTVRDVSSATQALNSLPKASGSKLLLLQLEVTNPEHYPKLASSIEEAGIKHLDIVIANSGVSPPSQPLAEVSLETITGTFDINAVGVLRLFQTVKHLLDNSPSGNPKWMTVGSLAGSLAITEQYGTFVYAPYAISKAAVHWITQAIHASEKSWTAFSVHPGLVQTEMGNTAAKVIGMEEAPTTIEEAVSKTIAMLDGATREATAGKLWDTIEAKELAW
ncbi:hypothetical protein BJY04DRAFT_178589 [Aspergillus karnatakaensis]|uniref:uncharacterized protein n=1 Tax=Aspergillus karnatakaensis TaxID=1810916 RepID=UPI003CCCA3CB